MECLSFCQRSKSFSPFLTKGFTFEDQLFCNFLYRGSPVNVFSGGSAMQQALTLYLYYPYQTREGQMEFSIWSIDLQSQPPRYATNWLRSYNFQCWLFVSQHTCTVIPAYPGTHKSVTLLSPLSQPWCYSEINSSLTLTKLVRIQCFQSHLTICIDTYHILIFVSKSQVFSDLFHWGYYFWLKQLGTFPFTGYIILLKFSTLDSTPFSTLCFRAVC